MEGSTQTLQAVTCPSPLQGAAEGGGTAASFSLTKRNPVRPPLPLGQVTALPQPSGMPSASGGKEPEEVIKRAECPHLRAISSREAVFLQRSCLKHAHGFTSVGAGRPGTRRDASGGTCCLSGVSQRRRGRARAAMGAGAGCCSPLGRPAPTSAPCQPSGRSGELQPLGRNPLVFLSVQCSLYLGEGWVGRRRWRQRRR